MAKCVFFSWQSDIKAAACRTFIETALKAAVAELSRDGVVEEAARVDHDTLDVPGAPDIGATILSKIETSAAFVADVTIVTTTQSARPTPNPNVLVELGYALHALGDARIILVQNVAFGRPELLPFDLRQKRVLTYFSAVDAPNRGDDRRRLQATLKTALGTILTQPAATMPPVALTIDYKRTGGDGTSHSYNLWVRLQNDGERRIDDWEIELEFPTQLLDATIQGLRVAERSGQERTLFRLTSQDKGPLRPGDAHSFYVGYLVTNEIFWNRKDLLDSQVLAVASIDGAVVARATRSMRELEDF